jgi:nucleotide-binding universal stress UspA family protein
MLPKKILFCADFSQNSEPARQLAVEFAKNFGAQLLLIHVTNPQLLKYPSLEDLPLGEVTLEDIQKKANETLETIAQDCRRDVAEVKTYLSLGVPAQAIVDFANEECVDLLVMGTHGWTGLSHMLVGSTAEHVVRMARRPVLTVWCCGPTKC